MIDFSGEIQRLVSNIALTKYERKIGIVKSTCSDFMANTYELRWKLIVNFAYHKM